MSQVFKDVACTLCGCVCDDLELTVQGGIVARAERECHLAEPWFAALGQPLDTPLARIDGNEASLVAAIEHSAELLTSSQSPLIFGLSRGSTDGHRAAISLAETLGATIDTAGSCSPGATLALQQVGQSTCSLGEVRNRADLVVFWNCDPAVTHPRHTERYSIDPPGVFVPQGRSDRKVYVIGSAKSSLAAAADETIEFGPEGEVVALAAIMTALGESAALNLNEGASEFTALRKLATEMKACRYGAIFFGITSGLQGQRDAEAIFQLTRELNKFTRFTAHYLSTSGACTGAENVLCWQAGFPFAVNFANGFPKYDPVGFSAEHLLTSGAVDACVLLGSESVSKLSSAAQAALSKIPTIALDEPVGPRFFEANVQITTAIYGIHAPGTAYRMDGVPIPLRQILPTHYPTVDAVLKNIRSWIDSRVPVGEGASN